MNTDSIPTIEELCPHGKAVGEGCPPCAEAYAKRIAAADAFTAATKELKAQEGRYILYGPELVAALKALREATNHKSRVAALMQSEAVLIKVGAL